MQFEARDADGNSTSARDRSEDGAIEWVRFMEFVMIEVVTAKLFPFTVAPFPTMIGLSHKEMSLF